MNSVEIPRPTEEQIEWWGQAWIAIVEDDKDSSDFLIETLKTRIEFFDGIINDRNIQVFRSGEQFLEEDRYRDFSVSFLDGRLGNKNITGPQLVPELREQIPQMIIIGNSAEDEFIEEFEELEVDYVLEKYSLTTKIDEILSLALREETDIDFD